jgi:hypothetical protein
MKILNLSSPLTREECLRRLRANVEQAGMRVAVCGVYVARWNSAGGAPVSSGVSGQIGQTNIHLYKLVEGQTVNSFKTHLFGRLTDNGGQTRLRCFVGMHPSVAAFMGLILGYLGWIFVVCIRSRWPALGEQ